MNFGSIELLGCGLLVGGFGAWFAFRQKRQSLAPTTESTEESRLVDTRSADALIVGRLDKPLIEITPIAEPTGSQSITAGAGIKAALQPLLSRTPELFAIGRDMTTRTMRVVFSPEVTRGLQNGTLSHVQDAATKLLPVARDARTGKFVEVARTVASGGIRLANVAAASWQIAAIATAQHYLCEINARLKTIEDRLADISFFQREEKRAELRASVRLLRQYYEAVFRGELNPEEIMAIYQKFEDIEHTCLAIGELARELARREYERLNGLAINEITNPKATAERAAGWVKESRVALELVFLAQSCRITACHVKAALPGDRTMLSQRIEHAKQELRAVANQLAGLRDAFHDRVVRPLDPKGDIFRKMLFYGDHRPVAEKAFAEGTEFSSTLVRQIESQAGDALRLSNQFDRQAESGLVLNVRVCQNGEVEVLSAEAA